MSIRLLLDENLSEALLARLPSPFDGSSHVRQLLGEGRSDQEVWNAAREGGFVLVTLDTDFERMSVMLGAPPKVVWIAAHNPNNRRLSALLDAKAESIVRFVGDPDASFLAITEVSGAPARRSPGSQH